MANILLPRHILFRVFNPILYNKQKAQPKNVHIVKPGETLGGIAAKYSVDIESLMLANSITDKNKIYVRQHLNILNGSASKEASSHAENKQKSSDKTTLSSQKEILKLKKEKVFK
nr:LysM domain-containing protein [Iodobacter ciconiae]